MSVYGPKEGSRRKELTIELCSKNRHQTRSSNMEKGQGDTRKGMVCSGNSRMSGWPPTGAGHRAIWKHMQEAIHESLEWQTKEFRL